MAKFSAFGGVSLLLGALVSFSCGTGDQRSERLSFTLPDGIMEDRSRAAEHSDDFGPIVAAYGKPDRDDSTAYDTPRPPLVTRFIEFHPENVKIIFYPDGRTGDPPPYSRWRVIGYIDINSNTKISAHEATRRMQSRIKPR